MSVFEPPVKMGVWPAIALPCALATSCSIGEAFSKSIVTLPAFAVSDVCSNLSCPVGSALTFTVAPILFGLDKFAHLLTNWDKYLAPWIARILPFSGHTFMLIVGVVEIVAGLIVAAKPKIGGYLVALWLLGIIINLVSAGGWFDIALRDFGLMLGAIALARLATAHETRRETSVAP